MAEEEEEASPRWLQELEDALGDCESARCSITEGQNVPDVIRANLWQVCLSTHHIRKGPPLVLDEIYDLPEQITIREDCRQFVDKLGNDDEDKVSVISNLESVITTYCKRTSCTYKRDNGWLEILEPLVALKLPMDELYYCFESIMQNFVPRQCHNNGQLFHLFRLLLLYHDPELCSYLDTKKITPEKYCLPWFRSLFASVCNLKVVHCMWDVYFQQGDPFLLFFLALVILINTKEQLMTFANDASENIIGFLSLAPTSLEDADISDFCSLAKFYSLRTPRSFRHDYHNSIFGSDNEVLPSNHPALCLSISIQELLANNQAEQTEVQNEDIIRYFIVDCRPAEQYNCGHLPTAFHLDASLMLQEPDAFATAVEALFTTQKHALAAESAAAGEHLCFLGSGREQEDQYVHMVVASVLQKHTQYVCMAGAGYIGLHDALKENLTFLVDHSIDGCIVCSPETGSQTSDTVDGDDILQKDSLLGRFRSVVKSKTAEFTEKLVEYVHNTQINQPEERHVSSHDKLGKRYRNMASVFTIDDDPDGELKKEEQDLISISAWLKNPEVVGYYKCHHVTEEGYTYSSLLVVMGTHLYILREQNQQEGLACVMARRSLSSIVRITSKRKHPEFVTITYGLPNGDSFVVTDSDRLIIPQAGDAAKLVKQQIVKTFT